MQFKTGSFKSATAAAMCAALLSLSACGGNDANGDDVAALDEKLVGKGSDPAMNGAVQDKILVDPDLAGKSNSNMVRSGDRPLDGKDAIRRGL
ncbi:MAG: hypothetical protein IPG54_13675 [Sphingomonadales bacterium]|nr:hypothetical protein [Sphingomonadales bacterium]